MSAHKSMDREEYDAWIAKASAPEPGKCIVPTPREDAAEVEKLLRLAPGSFKDSYIAIREGPKECPKCKRQTSLLDVIGDGAAFHGDDFVKGVIEGKHGIVYNPTPRVNHKCYACKEASPVAVPAYWCPIYGGGN
jgi:hypothetical protein